LNLQDEFSTRDTQGRGVRPRAPSSGMVPFTTQRPTEDGQPYLLLAQQALAKGGLFGEQRSWWMESNYLPLQSGLSDSIRSWFHCLTYRKHLRFIWAHL